MCKLFEASCKKCSENLEKFKQNKNIKVNMKKIVLSIICCLLTVNGFSAGWEDHWIDAMKYNSEEDYISAENEFDLSISNLEGSNESEKHSHVYIDRARLYMSQDRYDVALVDLDKALESKQLGKSDRIKGLVSRISTYSNLGQRERGFDDYLEFKELYSDFPEIEYGDTKIVIRNIPDCECAHGIMKNYLMNVKFCESEEDIQIVSPGMWVIKRKINDCECYEKAYKSLSERREDECKYWCDKFAFTANTWCSTSFKGLKCQTLCLVTVELLKDGCHLCCKGGDFYNNCVKPFEDILNAMGGKCNPDWNAK